MLCYVGKYLSDIIFSKELFQCAIVDNKPKYQLNNIEVYCVDGKAKPETISEIINNIHKVDLFYLFRDPSIIPRLKLNPAIYDNILDNEQHKYTWMSSKIASRLWVSNFIKTPPVCVITAAECTPNLAVSRFPNDTKFTLQLEFSSGGFGTFLIDSKKWPDLKSIPPYKSCILSPYFEHMLSGNAHIFISENGIITSPPTVQKFMNCEGRLLYSGCDYTGSDSPSHVLAGISKLAIRLKLIGYRGYCGIDFLYDAESFVFIEFNNRLQGSSALVDYIMQGRYGISLYQAAILTCKSNMPLNFTSSAHTIQKAQYECTTAKPNTAYNGIECRTNELHTAENNSIRHWRFQAEK